VHGRCIKKVPWNKKEYEDTYFGISCAAANLSLPSKHQLFSLASKEGDHKDA
jgi:hypothetical protein